MAPTKPDGLSHILQKAASELGTKYGLDVTDILSIANDFDNAGIQVVPNKELDAKYGFGGVDIPYPADIQVVPYEELVAKYGIGGVGIPDFAKEKKHAAVGIQVIPFSDLVKLLANLDKAVPEWLTSSEAHLRNYQEKETQYILVLLETRHWFAALNRNLEAFSPWKAVFDTRFPRHTHRGLLKDEDLQGRYVFKGCSFSEHVEGLERVVLNNDKQTEDYNTLKKTYFPNGIDDAISAFVKHCASLQHQRGKLDRRCRFLEKKNVAVRSSLIIRSNVLIRSCDNRLRFMLASALNWNLRGKEFRQRAQLPGNPHGLKYGDNVRVRYETNTMEIRYSPDDVMVHAWGVGWVPRGGQDNNPIRWLPGSPWIDWLRNHNQERYGVARYLEAIDQGKAPPSQSPGPLKLKLPQSLISLYTHFGRLYLDASEKLNEVAGIPGPQKTKTELNEQAAMLSSATGEPYWRVREFQTDDTHADLIPPILPTFERLMMDGMLNIRFDRLSAILMELRKGQDTPFRGVVPYIELDATVPGVNVVQPGIPPNAEDDGFEDAVFTNPESDDAGFLAATFAGSEDDD
ncbi:uncharacterized protein BCR38DRAFT_491005 [Pseudomassariella vexata]|uniref:Uncharacterized protein n=1 Tax=Pseudomassariella vexata TaxID=1141098 RepID=A0A1Y2D8X9_9PEZI|nr:uncharacterized protein BCR38DRAFT_491005 [Pseudomassariella vexata]ORY55667.1 hypothetical protein BCR38DRAFT_491005 [Pseudomassariella vexata]